MRLGNRRKRKDPSKNARVLVIDADPVALDRLSAQLRVAGFRVVALSKPDAMVPLARAFKPEIAIVGVGNQELESARIGRRVHRKFKGVVPVIYVGDDANPEVRRYCLDGGAGMDFLPRADVEGLLRRVKGLLEFKASMADSWRTELEARSPSLHDEVTGLYNRRFLLEMVSAEARRGARHGGCFSVVIAELDHFIEFRERHGDEVCDRLMVYASVLLRQALRESDVLAKVGRYHFGMLLPGMPAEVMPKLMERLERRFALARFEVEGKSLRASMTLGAATFPDIVGPAQQIFAKAIQELDRARDEKRTGPGPRAAM